MTLASSSSPRGGGFLELTSPAAQEFLVNLEQNNTSDSESKPENEPCGAPSKDDSSSYPPPLP